MRTESCPFCGTASLRSTHKAQFHPRKRDHGPFDLYRCADCGSVTTFPLPTPGALAALYGSFAGGVESKLRDLREATPLAAWFGSVMERATQLAGFTHDSTFRWIDVGAGGGELAATLVKHFPNASGTAIDWSPRPANLDERVTWLSRDLNAEPMPELQAELVISLSVWEHVLDPHAFVQKLLPLVAPGGLLYLVCPDAGSVVARVLGKRWPYFIPGEHLSMPTARGARRCVERAVETIEHGERPSGDVPAARHAHTIAVRPIGLPYPPAYVLGYLGLGRVSRLARRLPALPLPVGALETVCRRTGA